MDENSPSRAFEIPTNGTFLLAREVSNLQLNFSIFRKRLRRSAENLNFRAAIQIFAGDVRPPAGDLNFPRTSRIFSDKFSSSAELFDCSAAVSNFRRNAQRSADDSNFRPQFSIFPSCYEFSAELLKVRRHF